ncbi:MAG: hypothetical protein ACKOX2_18435, partial [Microcystaceae cyanobacterium]
PAELELAEFLTRKGVKMYSAFWCPHCYEQKQLFGKEAFQKIASIECDPNGKNPKTQACIDAKIQSFPTWEIGGKLDPGVKLLDQLAEKVGYTGSKDFKYTMP